MKTPAIVSLCLGFGLLTPVGAQNFADDSEYASLSRGTSASDVPTVEKAPGSPSEGLPVIASQDAGTLEPRLAENRNVDSVVNLEVLRTPSAFRKIAAGQPVGPAGIPADAMKRDLARISATYRESGQRGADCPSLELSVEQRVKLDASDVLAIVESEVMANPACACEIVKAAIKASDADSGQVVSIVEASIIAAPETMRIVSQCAIAAMPESLAGVQALLARHDPNAGESVESAKGAKGAKVAAAVNDVAAIPNPLDFPGVGPVGPTPGGPGGQPLVPPMPPIVIPPVTEVDP